MSDDVSSSPLAAELLAGPHEAETWRRFEGLDPESRDSVVRALKAYLDKLVRSDPKAALPVSETLLRAGDGSPQGRMLALRGRAVALHSNGDMRAALECYREAESHARAGGDDLAAARIQRSMVDVLHMLGRSSEALDCAQKARTTFAALGEERLLAQLEVNVGNVHFRLEQYARARSQYAQGRELFVRLGDRVGLAFTDFNLGNLETNAYEFDKAESAFRSAREILEAEDMAVVVADCDYSLAYLEFRRGRFAVAIQGLEAARELYSVHEKPSGAPLCDLDLAEIYLQLDLRRDALQHAERAATAFRELELDYETAKALVLASVARHRLGELEAAQANLDAAHLIAEKLGNDALLAYVDVQRFGMRANVEGERGLLALRDAWKTLQATGHRFVADLASIVLARALIASGNPDEAAELLGPLTGEVRRSMPLQRTLGPEIYRTLADAWLASGNRDSAIRSLVLATEAIEEAYAQVPGADGRIAFFRRPHEAFIELARLLLQASPDRTAEALSLLERGRFRSASLGASWSAGADADVARARERLDSLLGARLDAELGTVDTSRQAAAPSDEALRDAERDLRRASRRPTAAHDPATTSLDAHMLERAAPSGEVLLAYVLSPRGSSVFVVREGRAESVPLDLDPGRLRELSERLAYQVQKFRLGDRFVARHAAQLLASSNEILDELGALVLGPVRSMLGTSPVVIVPYGPLHNLPFHALRIGGRSLVETNEVSYAPSITALVRARAPRPGSGPFMLCGASEDSAPEIELELAGLMELLGPDVERVAASELRGRLLGQPPARGVLHIAAHGACRPGHPVFSGVRVGETFLTVHDIRQCHLDLDLVTLSGCETGRKVTVAGEELYSPDMALLSAGARCVVSSLWVLRDRDSARIMRRLYQLLAQGAAVRTAISRVQRESMEDHPHPWEWAPFIAVGDPLARIGTHGTR